MVGAIVKWAKMREPNLRVTRLKDFDRLSQHVIIHVDIALRGPQVLVASEFLQDPR